MIKSPVLIIVCLISILFVYISCQRDGDLTAPAGEKLQFSINGRVLDDQNLPVTGALVKAGNSTTQTDLNGNFQIKHVTLDANTGFVKVEKAGYFSGSRSFKPIKGSTHHVSLQLIKKDLAGSFSGTTGGSITVPNGGSVAFEAGSVITAQTKAPYTGRVSVSAFWLDPTAYNFLEIMPGELRGMDENNKQVGLQSFGMMVVELTGSTGERLQLSGSKPATMKFPIAASQLANAPTSIAFWSFNDTTGLWKQEGMATRQGNEYIGKASHFSFWNVDAPFELVDFKATLTDQDGNPLKRAKVIIRTANEETGPTACSYSDTAGVIAGWVPAGRTLKMIVISKCNEAVLTREIGPFSTKTDLGAITVTIPADSKVTFTGEILSCSGSPIVKGYADISIQGIIERAPIDNGVLNYSFVRCGNSNTKASVRLTDETNQVISGLKEIDITANTASLGKTTVCEEDLTEYLIFTFGTTNKRFLPPADTVGLHNFEGRHNISLYKKDTSEAFYLEFTPNQTNTEFQAGYSYTFHHKVYYKNAAPFTLNISEYGNAGEYVAGTFSGNMKDLQDVIVPITGRFRLLRK